MSVKTLKSRAETAFRALVLDKVKYLSETVWPRNIEAGLEKLNEFIAAGRELGVTNVEELSPTAIARIVKELSPLRALELKSDARARLVDNLYAQGFEVEFFEEPPCVAE